jgi:hypothetical protein
MGKKLMEGMEVRRTEPEGGERITRDGDGGTDTRADRCYPRPAAPARLASLGQSSVAQFRLCTRATRRAPSVYQSARASSGNRASSRSRARAPSAYQSNETRATRRRRHRATPSPPSDAVPSKVPRWADDAIMMGAVVVARRATTSVHTKSSPQSRAISASAQPASMGSLGHQYNQGH